MRAVRSQLAVFVVRCGSKWQEKGVPKRPDFKPVLTKDGWMVSVPAAMTASGKRERRFFREEKEAEKEAKALRGMHGRGLRGHLIPAMLAAQAAEAAAILEPFGISILEAAKDVVARYRAAGTLETFRERYDRIVKEREGQWRPRYARDMAKVPRWVGDAIMDTRVSDLTPQRIKAALAENGAKSPETIRARYARVASIVEGKETRPKRAPRIEIMNARECRRMLLACRTRAERRAAALAIYAGIRPDVESGEISRLTWDAVGKTEIYVSPDVSKTGADRHIPITPRLRRLLKGHPRSGPVTPANWARTFKRIRKEAGVSGKQDITRHTFASHYLAAFGEHAAKLAMGHTERSATLFRHYKRAVTQKDGKAFFR